LEGNNAQQKKRETVETESAIGRNSEAKESGS
jgi:hypothetical protein